jgi:hypothetical protein
MYVAANVDDALSSSISLLPNNQIIVLYDVRLKCHRGPADQVHMLVEHDRLLKGHRYEDFRIDLQPVWATV